MTYYESRLEKHARDAIRERTSTLRTLRAQEKYWVRQVEVFSELTDAAPELAKLKAVRDQLDALVGGAA